jgi:DNA-binding SARP family transcriptional activator
MISYEILGKVAARREDRVLALPAQQQLLLARLACAKGAPVPQRALTRAVWDQGTPPAGGLKRAIYELRTSLREELAATDVVVSGDDSYQLLLDSQQVDAFRFTARLDEASASADADKPRLAQEALDEWGPQASGLFGGYPLLGLDGSWAHGMRKKLRAQYRDVVINSLQRDAAAGDYESLLRKCARLAVEDQEDLDRRNPQDAMGDNDFLVLWMLAAYRSGQPERAEQVLRQATEIAARSGQPVNADLQRRAQQLRDEESRPSAFPDAPAAAPASPISPASDRKALNEPAINFNNNAGAVVNGQFGIVHGGVTFSTGRG